MKTYVKLGVALVLLAVLVYLLLVFDIPRAKAPDIAGDVTFTRSSSTLELIRVAEPLASSTVSSPLSVSGEARGSWYFEGSFPLEVIGENGSKLGEGIAQAKGDWMTSDFVPFTATVSFAPKGNKAGIVRFMKDNPSGEARFNAHMDIPVIFVGTAAVTAGTRANGSESVQ